jgi:hypothetical protein
MARILPLSLLLALAAAPAAHAAGLARTGTVVDLSLAGDRVVYSDSHALRSAVRSVPFGGPASTLVSSRQDSSDSESVTPAVAASPQLAAAWLGMDAIGTAGATPAYRQLLTGSPSGPLQAARRDEHPAYDVTPLDVSGTDAATVEGTPPRAYLNGTAFGPSGALDVRVAGAFTAVAVKDAPATRTVIVYDRGAEAYRVTFEVTEPYGYEFDFDLADDGTVAAYQRHPGATGDSPAGDLAWASRAAPTPHVLATVVDLNVPVRIAGGRILYGEAAKGGGTQMRLASLDGSSVPVGFPVLVIQAADFDGSRYAFATEDCVYGGPVSEDEATARAGACPLVDAHVIRVEVRRRRVSVGVECDVTPDVCAGRVELRDGRRVVARRAVSRRGFFVPTLRIAVPRRALHRRATRIGVYFVPRGGVTAAYPARVIVRR